MTFCCCILYLCWLNECLPGTRCEISVFGKKITFVWWDNKKSYICNKMNNLDLSENQRLGGGSKAKAVPSVDPAWCFESRFVSSKLSRCPPA